MIARIIEVIGWSIFFVLATLAIVLGFICNVIWMGWRR